MSEDDSFVQEEVASGAGGGNGRSPINFTIIIMLVVLALAAAFTIVQWGRGSGDDTANNEGADIQAETVGLEAQQDIAITVQVEGEAIQINPSLGIPEVIVQLPTNTPEPTVDPNLQPTLEPAPTLVPAPTDNAQIIIPTNPPPAVNNGVNPVIFINHTVQAGDTLYGMTRRYATAIALMAMNGIDQDDFVPGAVLQIPVGNPAFCLNGLRPYAVDAGETVFAIGQRYNISKDEMRNLNPAIGADYAISAGQILCVP